MKIPFVDLKSQYHAHKKAIDQSISDVIEDTAFIGGSSNKYVTGFEKEFASYLGLNYVVTCANGTDSLEILLEAYNIGPGDEVIVPALSWISTSEAVGRIGAKPIFIDVCNDTLLIDTKLIEQKISTNVKAIIPVHLYGNAVDMIEIMRIAGKHNLIVIEDCAQSHGASFNGKLVGTFGHASSFSFYPGKNLGAYGDAGCIATNEEIVAKKCRMIANHGQLEKHNHIIEGRNSRLDGINAAVLSVKLPYLNEWNNQRVKHANFYTKTLSATNYLCPVVNENATHVFHLYVIRHNKRDLLRSFLSEHGVETAIHYPTPLPLLNAYTKYGYSEKDFPVAASECLKILSIPMFPELNREQISRITTLLVDFDKLR